MAESKIFQQCQNMSHLSNKLHPLALQPRFDSSNVAIVKRSNVVFH